MAHQLGPATTAEIDQRPLLLVPLGSTEQHGPHLPLDTDTRIAEAWAKRLAQRLPSAVVAPSLPYGSSGEHQSFSGTLSIGQEVLRLLVMELTRSAAFTFRGVVLVCGHGGNAAPILAAAEQARTEGHRIIALLPHWPDRIRFPALDAHAGRTETSLLLHLAPHVVRWELAEAGSLEPLHRLINTLGRDGVEAVSANGVLGDPSGAGAEEGRLLFDDLVERSAVTISDFDRGRDQPLDKNDHY